MNKYKITDLKVGAVFKDRGTTRTIVTVGEKYVFYISAYNGIYMECTTTISNFLGGHYGKLVKPTTKVTYVQYWNCLDLSSKKACIKELWDSRASTNNKFIREFEIEVGEDGFPIDSAL